MKTHTRKVLIGIPATAIGLYLLWLCTVFLQNRLLAKEARRDVGYKLMLQFKSPHVPTIPTNTLAQLKIVHLRAPHVRVYKNDAPAPFGDGSATYHIIYTLTTNWDTRAEQPILGLRLKIQGTNHNLLGHWIPTEKKPGE